MYKPILNRQLVAKFIFRRKLHIGNLLLWNVATPMATVALSRVIGQAQLPSCQYMTSLAVERVANRPIECVVYTLYMNGLAERLYSD
jgi:hypothetical protein